MKTCTSCGGLNTLLSSALCLIVALTKANSATNDALHCVGCVQLPTNQWLQVDVSAKIVRIALDARCFTDERASGAFLERCVVAWVLCADIIIRRYL